MLKKIKAQAIAFTLIATLTNNTANAVYPVFDSGNLQHNITSYIQDVVAQAKDYAMQNATIHATAKRIRPNGARYTKL